MADMSDDLVERLRLWSVPNHMKQSPQHDCHEAADRIEALERELEITKASLADQEAENIRFRESEKP